MRVAVTSPFFHFFPHLKDELLEQYPDAKFKEQFPSIGGDELVEFCQGYQGAIIGLDRFDDYVLSRLPELKVIGLCSAGADHIDPAAMKKHGVRMGWVAGINKVAVSEMTISHIINIMRNFHKFSNQMYDGNWPSLRNGALLNGRTVGLHGCGHIGKEVVKRLIPFGVNILACDRLDFSDFYEEYGVEAVDQEELWARSDVLSLHLSRNATTIGLYSADVLAKLKQGVYLVNTSRGNIVDEVALKSRLESGDIAAAAFDVYAVEPAIDDPLFALPNFFGTPHTGAGADEAWEAMARSGIKGLTENWIPEPGEYPYD
ncbi:MAG: phosphoglycerate dehydrogenase [Rhodospirillaceae bacterium]|jgi:D-3-phosphoglycerate dehydrogenase|nr:phosphoglycerate dehydrogenase [Rhodospirillaceae bacterium]